MSEPPDPPASRRLSWEAELLVAQAQQLLADHRAAVVQDANLARLRSQDPDAERLFPSGTPFADAVTDRSLLAPLTLALGSYARLKEEQGRDDLLERLFDGVLPPGQDRGPDRP
ncbi:hypothetical protein ACFV6F_12915 [Kitasatospora phosalacinea]|uniref:hypothetical protein n=1 Tax=Kitasatospora phosalacinea TaxID=2065 RepID=UPI00365D2981